MRAPAVRRAYQLAFVWALVACFSPFKALAYIVPAMFTAYVALHGGVVRDRLVVLGLALGGAAIAYALVLDEFLLTNYAVAIITYSAFLPVLVIDSRLLASRELLRAIVLAASTMLAVQGVVGIIQALHGFTQTGSFGGANGDYVAGTIYPALRAEHAFSNPMFAVNMALMLLCCLVVPEASTGPRRAFLILGAVALVLASVLHVLVFLVVAALVGFAITRTRDPRAPGRWTGGRVLAVVALISGLTYVALPDNVAGISSVAERAFDLDAVTIPRAVLLTRVFSDLPEEQPQQPAIGLGPGQFSSRASLIMSGLFLGGPDTPKTLPFLSPQATHLTQDYCLLLMVTASENDPLGQIGSSQQPFFSLLSIYTELGLAGLIAVMWSVARVLLRVRRRVREAPSVQLEALVLCAGVLLIGLLGWQENYWETPQAILVGLLLLKVLYANIMYNVDRADVRA